MTELNDTKPVKIKVTGGSASWGIGEGYVEYIDQLAQAGLRGNCSDIV